MSSFEPRFDQLITMTEEYLSGCFADKGHPYGDVLEAMEYSLLSGGKRIRALLVLAFYELLGGNAEKALPFAAAVEMIHCYSLIHDDLPCMDDDDTRRGKPSCHIAYGEATALLAGDGLLNLAFETMLDCDGFPAQTVLRAAGTLAAASGVHGMIGGQAMDLANEGRMISAEELDAINLRKTGALIRAASGMGCILGGATERQLAAADEFSRCIGLAFQIMDDVLDVTADPGQLGKPVGSDAGNNKQTYAGLFGIEECRKKVAGLNSRAKEALSATERDTGFLCGLADLLANRDY